jgi:hypothetical protein
MIKRTWDFLGDVRLSFWLLLAAAALFLAGMFHSTFDYSYFRAMNELRIQDWLARELPSRPGANWWLPLLLCVLFFLGVNTVICTINRVIALFAGQKRSGYHFVQSLLPSIVHLLFITVMIGHAITATAGSWTRRPLAQGEQVVIDPSVPPLAVHSIRDTYYPTGSLMANRIRRTEVILKGENTLTIPLSFLESVSYHGYRLQLDMVKHKKEPIADAVAKPKIVDSEICNKAETFRSVERRRESSQKLLILAIRDPGLPVRLAAFTLILIIMTWYFVSLAVTRNGTGENSAPGIQD